MAQYQPQAKFGFMLGGQWVILLIVRAIAGVVQLYLWVTHQL